MRTRDLDVIADDIEDAVARLPIGTRVRTASNPNLGTVRWRPFICDAGTVSVLVAWDNLPLDRNTHYVFTRNLVTV
jgi:hypothetical protein